MDGVKKCRECGSADLFWFAVNINKSGVAEGRLRTHEVTCRFVLGCHECSETLQAVDADRIAEQMNSDRSELAALREELIAAEQRNAILGAEIKKLTPWVKGVGSTKLRDHAYQLIASAPCEKCKGKGFIDFTDKDLRNANNGAWGRCLTCRPYEVSLTKPTESGASE